MRTDGSRARPELTSQNASDGGTWLWRWIEQRLNPHRRLRRECGTRQFNDFRLGGVEGCATRRFPPWLVSNHGVCQAPVDWAG